MKHRLQEYFALVPVCVTWLVQVAALMVANVTPAPRSDEAYQFAGTAHDGSNALVISIVSATGYFRPGS